MKPKNIMLLGFVNKAVEYLDKHMDEEPNARLAELKNIDLASIRDELSDNLDASLGTMQSTMSTLLKAGNEAFDEFIEDTHGKDAVADQFNRMFDVDFDDNRKNSQEELARLLSFYNLENDFDDSYELENPIEEDIFEPIEDDEFLNEIRKNATNDDTDDIMPIEHNDSDDEEIDSIFTEIVENENCPVELKETTSVEMNETKPVEIQETPVVEEEKKETYIIIENPAIDNIAEEPVEEQQPNEEIVKPYQPIENPGVDTFDETEIDDIVVEENKEQENFVEEVIQNNIPIENPGVDQQVFEQETAEDIKQEEVVEEQVSVQEPVKEVELEETIHEQEVEEEVEAEETIIDDVSVEEEKEAETKNYVESLIDELKEELVKEEQKEAIDNKNKEIYEHIAKLYPYLPDGFVKSVYELKESISAEYPLNAEMIILHRVAFKDVGDLRKFAEIVLNHDYAINADEKKMFVDVFRKFTNTDGKILSNIYEIANQAYLLNGVYEGYNVINQED